MAQGGQDEGFCVLTAPSSTVSSTRADGDLTRSLDEPSSRTRIQRPASSSATWSGGQRTRSTIERRVSKCFSLGYH